MPIYDQRCGNCGINEAYCYVDERHTCQLCGGKCDLVPAPFRAIGIVFSNAETSKQLGVTWETNQQKRDWFKKHPNVMPVTKGSQEDKDFAASIRGRADTLVKGVGFKNAREYHSEGRKMRASEKKEKATG